MTNAKRMAKVCQLGKEVFGILLSLVVAVPFVMIFVNSGKSLRDANKVNLSLEGFSFSQLVENYSEVIEMSDIFRAYLNSAIITLISVVGLLLVAGMAAFVIARRQDKIFRRINTLLVAAMTLPLCMVPAYFMLSRMNLHTNIWGAVLTYIASGFPFSVFIYIGFLKGIPRELDEAAIIDGCGPVRLYFQIIMPLIKPATVTLFINNAMSTWNDFGISVYLLNTPERYTAVLTTYNFMGQQTSRWNLLFADVILISLPVIILYVCMQKHIVAGLTSGAVKG